MLVREEQPGIESSVVPVPYSLRSVRTYRRERGDLPARMDHGTCVTAAAVSINPCPYSRGCGLETLLDIMYAYSGTAYLHT